MNDLEVLAVAILFLSVFVNGFVLGITFSLRRTSKSIDNDDDHYPD